MVWLYYDIIWSVKLLYRVLSCFTILYPVIHKLLSIVLFCSMFTLYLIKWHDLVWYGMRYSPILMEVEVEVEIHDIELHDNARPIIRKVAFEPNSIA